MPLNRALITLPWRMMLPILLVIGFVLTLWGGYFITHSNIKIWRGELHDIVALQHQDMAEHWAETAGKVIALAQQPRGGGTIVLPDNSPIRAAYRIKYDTPAAQIDAGTVISAQVKPWLERLSASDYSQKLLILGPNAAKAAKISNHEILLVTALAGNDGWLITIIDPKRVVTPNIDLVSASGLASSHYAYRWNIRVNNNVLQQDFISQLTDPGWRFLRHKESYTTDWGQAKWSFDWEFSSLALGGPLLWPGITLSILGIFVTMLVTWMFGAQQSLAQHVQSQVMLRTQQLEHSSRRFRLITDNAYDLVATLNTEAEFDYCNNAYQRVLGYHRESLINKPMADLIHPKDLPAFQRFWDKALKDEPNNEATLRFKSKNGEWFYLECVSKGIHDENWLLSNIVIHARDITSRKLYADELSRSEQRFRDFADSSADWLWEMNEDYIFTYVSPGVKTVLGYDPEDLVGQLKFEDLFIDEDEPAKDLIESRVIRQAPYREIEFWTKSKQGDRVCLRVSAVPVFNERQLFAGYRGAASNITASKLEREMNYRLATHDTLTNLLNRRHFTEELDRTVSLARRHGTKGVIIWIDLDRFKEVNDTYGHEAGDKILVEVSRILMNAVRTTDIVARLGGDEFAIIMHDIDTETARHKMEAMIQEANSLEVDYNGRKLQVTMSVGLVSYPNEDKSGSELLMAADLAMYRAKDMGRNRLYVGSSNGADNANDGSRDQLYWLELLRKRLLEDSFELHFQPLLPADASAPIFYEALLRIKDDEGNYQPPFLFIEAAEHFGLIHELDLAVMNRCFKIQRMYKKEHGLDLYISINISTRSIGDPEIVERIRKASEHYEVDPAHFIIEITETAALHDPRALRELDKIKDFIAELQEMGFKIAIDDFGSGFSSFWYLRTVDVDMVKIDGNYVKELDKSVDDYLFVKAMSEVAQGRGIITVAEFVENADITQQLLNLGIEYGQGYHIHKPSADLKELHEKLYKLRLGDYASHRKDLPQPTPATVKEERRRMAKQMAAAEKLLTAIDAPKRATTKKKSPAKKPAAKKATATKKASASKGK